MADSRINRPVDTTHVPLTDVRRRPLRDLRISLTDRCNFRCQYCMPREVFGPDFEFLPRGELLNFDEIVRVAGIFAKLGVAKLRLTGGEPLLRRDIVHLIPRLAEIEGIEDIALTTNGSRLTPQLARDLTAAGLKRITISLDSLNDATFGTVNGVNFPVAKVLSAIEASCEAGMTPVKVNVVVKRGVNEGDIIPIARHFRGTPCIPRFIEYMDVGNTNGWRMDDVVSADAVIAAINEVWPLTPLTPNYQGEVSRRYQYADGQGEIGVIASVTRPFCGNCSRARLSPEGKLFTCLFGSDGFDLKKLIRSGVGDEEILSAVAQVWSGRHDQYSEIRTTHTKSKPKVEMSHIGG